MLNSGPYLLQAANDVMIKIKSIASDSQLSTENSGEPCPACQAQIPLQDDRSAVCPNGHVWSEQDPDLDASMALTNLFVARCSITSFILATPMVRTCTGCGRKAFLPVSQSDTCRNLLPPAVRDSWLAIDLLDAIRRCFFCGCNFVTLV